MAWRLCRGVLVLCGGFGWPGFGVLAGTRRWLMATTALSAALSRSRLSSPLRNGSHWPVPCRLQSPGASGCCRRAGWACGSSPAGASSIGSACSRPAGRTSGSPAAIWKPVAAPGPPSPGGCALSPGSAGTRPGREQLDHWPAAHAAGLAWPKNRAPQDWTAASPARCWPPPGPARRRNTR